MKKLLLLLILLPTVTFGATPTVISYIDNGQLRLVNGFYWNDNTVITAAHTLRQNRNTIMVDGKLAKSVILNEVNDIAVINLKNKNKGKITTKCSYETKVHMDNIVSDDDGIKKRSGIKNRVEKSLIQVTDDKTIYGDMWFTDYMRVAQGDSGGALLDDSNNLVGIININTGSSDPKLATGGAGMTCKEIKKTL